MPIQHNFSWQNWPTFTRHFQWNFLWLVTSAYIYFLVLLSAIVNLIAHAHTHTLKTEWHTQGIWLHIFNFIRTPTPTSQHDIDNWHDMHALSRTFVPACHSFTCNANDTFAMLEHEVASLKKDTLAAVAPYPESDWQPAAGKTALSLDRLHILQLGCL